MSGINIKNNNIKTNIKYYLSYFGLTLILLLTNFFGLIATKKIRNLNNNNHSKVVLIIKGKEIQNILENQFPSEASKILINGVIYEEDEEENYLLNNDINNITLIFEDKFKTCKYMFNELNNIIEIYLTNFDFSEVTIMTGMFGECSNLEKINFGNINASSVEDMEFLFFGCNNLKYLDLSNFDFSKVTSMSYMFAECFKLEKINFGNANTSSLINMESLFYGCSELKSLDLSNFDTSKVKTMYSMLGE